MRLFYLPPVNHMTTVHRASNYIAWDDTPGAVAYNVRVLGPGGDPVTVGPAAELTVTLSEVEAVDLFLQVADGVWDVYVRGQDDTGAWGPYSAAFPVTLVSGPAAPTGLTVL